MSNAAEIDKIDMKFLAEVEFAAQQRVISIKVGMWLLQKQEGFSFEPSESHYTARTKYQLTETPAIDIFYKDPNAKPIKYLFGFITKEPNRKFVGRIYFSGVPSEAALDCERYWFGDCDDSGKQRWTCNYHHAGGELMFDEGGKLRGKPGGHNEFVRQLIEEMALEFDVNITLCSLARRETVWDDGGD